VLEDLLAHEAARTPKARALESMMRSLGRYDPKVLEAVAAVFDICLAEETPPEAQSCEVGIKTLRVGNVLAAPARTRAGALIVPSGTRMSPMLLEKLRNFAQLGDLEEPIQVIKQ
jgi:hypothetical protein